MVGGGNSLGRGGGNFEILLLFYLEIELAFQIINITMVSFKFLCLFHVLFYVIIPFMFYSILDSNRKYCF